MDALRGILQEYSDVFRVEFGHDPPVAVEPIQLRLKDNVTPVKCGSRRYPPVHRKVLQDLVSDLVKHGLVYMSHLSPCQRKIFENTE